jgi:L-histidine N-alpha-methyltransferase
MRSTVNASQAAYSAPAIFLSEVCEYLLRTPRQLPSKYLYDDLGSALFEAICLLPWYRITRAESGLLEAHAPEILASLRRPISLTELGCGSGEKLALLARAAGERSAQVQLIDISQAALDMSRRRLGDLGYRSVLTHHCTYEQGLVRAARNRPRDGSLLVLFLGSNIGNFDPPVALDLLARVRRVLRDGDALLLGADLVKPESDLLRAYDDPLGVTAAFNKNLLRRINDELGGTFDLDRFVHRATWNQADGRVEMHLVSRECQRVRIDAANFDVHFEKGESIWTESSHKYTPDQILRRGFAAGFTDAAQWVDSSAGFALTRFDVG